MKKLAEKYNAVIIEEDFINSGTGKLKKIFNVNDYIKYVVVENGSWVDTTNNKILCNEYSWVESIVEFEDGEAIQATYCFKYSNNTSSNEIEDDVLGVINLWENFS